MNNFVSCNSKKIENSRKFGKRIEVSDFRLVSKNLSKSINFKDGDHGDHPCGVLSRVEVE